MTVLEYEYKFLELQRYATNLTVDQDDLVERFMDGLNQEIRSAVISLSATRRVIDEIVETTQGVERVNISMRLTPRVPSFGKGVTKFEVKTGGTNTVTKGYKPPRV